MSYFIEKLKQIKQDDLQHQAYKSEHNTVVIAGPGSGKTTVLTLKIMRLLNQSINKPRGLACLTYNNEAVREFKDKLDLMGYKKRQNVFLGTVHSFCIAEILNVFGQIYNYNITYPIKIISDNEKKKLFETIKKEQGYEQKSFKKDDMDRVRNLKIRGKSKVIVTIDRDILKVANEYEDRLEKIGMMDYESIINYSTRMIQEHEYVRKCLSAKFPWILIDEYQDLGKPLHEMILSLFEYTDIKIFAVGDPDQSIYSFSGATPNYLLELRNKENIEVIELKNNYRSNQDIVDGSETVLNIKRNYNAATRKDEKAKFYFITCEEDMNRQYEYCAKRIIPFYQKKGLELEEIAILVGNKYEAKEMGICCLQNNIPFYISKHTFDRTDTVKWIEKMARWIIDKTKESFEEIQDFYEKLLLSQRKRKFFSDSEAVENRKKLYEILINSNEKKDNLKEWIEYIIENTKLNEILKNSYMYPDEIENIENLLKEISEENYKDYDIYKFSNIGKPKNQITITTRHSSKGLEFEVIILLGMEEGKFPDYRKVNNLEELEEENRLCFVSVSRAKSTCILMRSKYNNIKKKDGTIWHKPMEASRYWTQLEEKYRKKK